MGAVVIRLGAPGTVAQPMQSPKLTLKDAWVLIDIHLKDCRCYLRFSGCTLVVLAMGPGNPPAVRVWTAKTGRFSSTTVQNPDPLTHGGPNPDPYQSIRGFCWVWLDPWVPISGSGFRVSYLWAHSDMLLLIVKYWHWYVPVHFRRISRLDVQNKHTHAPNHILKRSVNRASTERQQSVNNI